MITIKKIFIKSKSKFYVFNCGLDVKGTTANKQNL